jgi:type IV pilus assembly protein PilY1
MLHAFKAKTGDELFAYIPNNVIVNLPELSKKTYSHLYYVDGSPKAADALVDGTWKTILVGSTGAGGRAYFALDVEAPTSFGTSKVLWEFSSSNDADLGVAMGQASIVRTESGHWVAIFGNGYNGASNTAQLFIVDLKTGALLKKIDTKVGTAANPNGLGTPVVVDADVNGAADLVYAGDMQGNLWKFDLSGSSIASWGIPLGTSDAPVPLFNATYGSGATAKAQPITDKPQVARHRPSGGLIVYFGTGQFFETGDQANLDVQSFYGVIDVCGRYSTDSGCNTYTTVESKPAKLHRADLLQQSILQEYTETFGSVTSDVRILSANALDYSASSKQGFYLDLLPPTGTAQGERVVATPLLMDDRVIYTTLIPDTDPCSNGVSGWLMEVDPLSGARTLFSVFDLNNDGVFDKSDNASGGTGSVVNGRKLPGGMLKAPALIGGNKYGSNSSGNLTQINQSSSSGVGRQSWRQIR